MRHRQGWPHENGAALVISLLMLAVLLLLGSGALTNSRLEKQSASNDEKAKRVLFAAEYGVALGEQTLEQATRQSDLKFGSATGFSLEGTQPPWQNLQWDDRDSISASTFFALPHQANPNGLPPLPQTMLDSQGQPDEHIMPRLMLEEKFFKRDSLTTGQGLPSGISYFNVAAHGGRAQWTVTQRPGTNNPQAPDYDERYLGTRTILQSVYAKRYN